MKRKMVLVALLAMILMVIGGAALAAWDTMSNDGVTVTVDCASIAADGRAHSSSVKISKVEVNKASVNNFTIKVYFKSTCDQCNEHGTDRTSYPLPMELKRTSCTDEMYKIFFMNHGKLGSDAYESVYVQASASGAAHTWENGKCKDCPAECDHAGNQTPPSCTQSAECSVCGKTVYALGHNAKTIDRMEPTCTQPGHTEGSYCERCKEVFTESATLNALGHDTRTIDRLEPTCTQPGHTEGSYCERCKAVIAESATIKPAGHQSSTIPALEPTCTQTGLTAGERCAVCNTVLEEQQPIPAKGHDYRTETIAPTCTKGGYAQHTCAACGDSYMNQRTARLGHSYDLWRDSGNSKHTASCLRKGCGHSATVECSVFEYTLPEAAREGDTQAAFCPVCGFRKNADAMAAVENAELIQGELSKGEIIVREALLSANDKLFTVAFEYAGTLVQPGERMVISLPIALAEGEVLTLLNPDGIETAIECVFEENATRVTLEYPKEDDTETNLVRVLHLTKTNPTAD